MGLRNAELNVSRLYIVCMFSAKVILMSKNLSILQVGRDLKKKTSRIKLFLKGGSVMKKDHPNQGFMHSSLEHFQGRKFHNFSG